ncbi:YncE family protein [Zobellia alginiliquefaciens]|uniref:YncE family protein n=1 Tax=Zobellia alginiliquefaciens TaxID=3032586 RepID=UPI0023E0F62D|nr:hypothetical protein [Zobellia alginiliquefaciens]
MKKLMSCISAFAIVISTVFISCTKEGPQGEQGIQGEPGLNAQTVEPAVFGQWEVLEGTFGLENSKYVYINNDNTITILSEDAMGFKNDYISNVMVTEDQITMNASYYGNTINNYSLENNELTILSPESTSPIILQKIENGPAPSEWIKSLNILNEGPAQWEDSDVDIAFDGDYLLGWDKENSILQIDPNTLSVIGSIPTAQSAYAIEIEKSDDPSRQFFQSNNGSSNFYSYTYTSNTLNYTSESIASWIKGIASIEPGILWVSSSSDDALYRYKYDASVPSAEILETIALDFQPGGMDFRNGYLYFTNGTLLYKCQTTPEFSVVETYKIDGHYISGVTFDGTNFWLTAQERGSYTMKIIKTDLTI